MITTRSFAVLGLSLALGLAVFGVQIGRAVKKGREFDRYLTVRGLSEKEVMATLALWPVRFAVSAETLPELKTSMEATRLQVEAFLREQGIKNEEITIGLPSISDRLEQYRDQAEQLPRYKAVVTLVVRSPQVDVVKKAIQRADGMLQDGISLVTGQYGDSAQFEYEEINAIKPSMIQEATANARAAAEKFAQDSKAKVGAIRKASQGALEIHDRDVASPEKKILRVVTTVEFFLE